MDSQSIPVACAWCGTAVDGTDCWVLRRDDGGEEEAAFCRLEHIVPWAMRPRSPDLAPVSLLRHRGNHLIEHRFDTVAELGEWAKSGGPWRQDS